MWQYNYTDELYHYGVLGMKWGRRKRSASQDAKDAAAIKKKRVGEMSNAELKKLNERQNLEQNHKRLNPSAIQKGAKYVATATIATTTLITLYNNSNKIIDIGKKITSKI